MSAIPASTLRQIVRTAIEQHTDRDQLTLTRIVEAQERDGQALAGRWSSS